MVISDSNMLNLPVSKHKFVFVLKKCRDLILVTVYLLKFTNNSSFYNIDFKFLLIIEIYVEFIGLKSTIQNQ